MTQRPSANVRTLDPAPSERPTEDTGAPLAEMITDLIEEVRADAQREPAAYLRQSVVPHGGE